MGGQRWLRQALVCLVSAGVTTVAYTFRGSGVMDYKCTVAVNLLWLAWVVCAAAGSMTGKLREDEPEGM